MNKVSADMFKVFTNGENETAMNWNNLDIIVANTLSLVDAMSFVDEVVDLCFSDDGEYRPELKDFVIDRAMLRFYTNIDLGESAEFSYEIVNKTNICEKVYEYINENQFKSMLRAADEKMMLRAKANVEMLNKNFNELIYNFGEMQDKITAMFSNIDANDISNLVNAISNSELDELKLVKAYIEQTK